jgi:hypothetical protein
MFRPATNSSARRSAATVPHRGEPRLEPGQIDWWLRRHAEQGEVERRVDVEGEVRSRSKVVDREAGHLLQPQRDRVVTGKVRDRG